MTETTWGWLSVVWYIVGYCWWFIDIVVEEEVVSTALDINWVDKSDI